MQQQKQGPPMLTNVCHNSKSKSGTPSKETSSEMLDSPSSTHASSSAALLLVIKKDSECDKSLYEQEFKDLNHVLMLHVSENIQDEILVVEKNTMPKKPKGVKANLCSPDCVAEVERNRQNSPNLANKVK